ncbi:MAG: MarR family winged helix-turn-helix transcriptional regulator [Acetobacteraceae bacterium]
MRKASRRLTQLYDDALGPAGIRSTQFAILTELDRRAKAPPTMRELANALVMDRSALGHNLRPLERDDFIELRESDEDRRRRYVALTPQASPNSKRPNASGKSLKTASTTSSESRPQRNCVQPCWRSHTTSGWRP